MTVKGILEELGSNARQSQIVDNRGTPTVLKLIVRCGTCGGTREAHYPADTFPRELIAQLAELLDGSSTYYTQPPSPDTPFGRCTKCGGQFRARVL